MAESRIDLHGLSRKPVLLEPYRAGVDQRRVQSGLVVPGQPGDNFVLGLAPRHQALAVQPLHLQRLEQRLAAGVVPTVAAPAYRGRAAVFRQHVPEILAGVIAAFVAVEDQSGLLTRMTLELSHAQRVDDG